MHMEGTIMTVIRCTGPYGCDKTFVTIRKLKQHEKVMCPFCGNEGGVLIHEKGTFKGEGVL